MKLIDILVERKQVPVAEKIDISVLKEYIFKDWQTFNQKIVPSFKFLRSRVVKENYTSLNAKSNIMSVVDFAAKKYVAECTSRKYLWNELFTKADRVSLVNELVEFFEQYNLNESSELIVEQGVISKEAKITFDRIEVEMQDNRPVMVITFRFNEQIVNFITNALGDNKTIKVSDNDLEIINGIISTKLTDMTSGKKLSYLKLGVNGQSIQREDVKNLIGFLNRPITLEVVESSAQPADDTSQYDVDGDVPVQNVPPSKRGDGELRSIPKKSLRRKRPVDVGISDNDIREVVKESIRNVITEGKVYFFDKNGRFFSTGKDLQSVLKHKERFGDEITFSVQGINKIFNTVEEYEKWKEIPQSTSIFPHGKYNIKKRKI